MLQETPQIVGQCARRQIPVARVLGQRFEEDRLQFHGQRSFALPQWPGLLEGDLTQQRLLVTAVEHRFEGQQFVECGAQRVDVRAAVDDRVIAQCLFGTHVSQCPH